MDGSGFTELVKRGVSWTWCGFFGILGGRPTMGYKHFSDEEAKGLSPELMSKLDTAREVAGVPFLITSGLRSCDANTAALGVEGSAHLSGKAVDLACSDGLTRFNMVRGLLAAGFVRLGVYDKHCHVDVDDTKPPNVIWTGVSH